YNAKVSASNSLILGNGANVGIGTSSPAAKLSVGSSSQFQVNNSGNILKINNVSTSFPSSQGSNGQVLTNDGSGTLSWLTPTAYSAGTGLTLSGTTFNSAFTANGNDIYNNNSGNVGVGNSSPASKLSVGSSSQFQVNN